MCSVEVIFGVDSISSDASMDNSALYDELEGMDDDAFYVSGDSVIFRWLKLMATNI